MECVKIRFRPPTDPGAARRALERAVKSVNRQGLWPTLYVDFFAFTEVEEEWPDDVEGVEEQIEGQADEAEDRQELLIQESPFFGALLSTALSREQLTEVASAAEIALSYGDLTPDETEAIYREALDITDGAAPEYAAASQHLALLLLDAGRVEEAERLLRGALARYAARTGADADAAETRYHLARLLAGAGRNDEAETLYCQAMDAYRELSKRNSGYQAALARTCADLASCLRDSGRPEAAEWFYRTALDLYRKLAERVPAAYAPRVASVCGSLAGLLQVSGRVPEAAALYRVALDTYTKLVQEDPSAWEPRLAFLYENLAEFEDKLSRKAGKALLRSAYLLYQKYPEFSAEAERVQARLRELDEV